MKNMNNGTAFTSLERETLGLIGTLPSAIHSLEQQVEIEYLKLCQQQNNLSKSHYLFNLYHVNPKLYFALVQKYVKELLPIIYTPTIAESVTSFSENFLWRNDALYLDSDHPEQIEEALINATRHRKDPGIMVITDGEAILGIGDWGINGVMISLGKSFVYTVAAGIEPDRILPVIIDNGTNRQELLESPIYLGKKKPRLTGEAYYRFIDQFVEVNSKLYPNVLLHWEDFGKSNAQTILDRYKNRVLTFNDDIQGTGVTVVSAISAALKVKEESYDKQKFVIFGAGTAGVGIATQIKNDMLTQGLSEEEALGKIYLVDKQGLITKEDAQLTKGQKYFAHNSAEFSEVLSDLESVVQTVQPTFLIGTSGQTGAFNQAIVQSMTKYQERPAIFPLSNPSKLAEAEAKDLVEWTEGHGLVVTGSPTEPFLFDEITYHIGQANNALFYPGLALGIIASKATKVTDHMLSAAAHASQNSEDLKKMGSSLLPAIENIQECSLKIAEAVFEAAIDDGVSSFDISDVSEQIRKQVWKIHY